MASNDVRDGAHRLAYPHVGVDVLAADDPALALGLLRAEHLLVITRVLLGECVEGTVFFARLVGVHVHFVFYVAL